MGQILTLHWCAGVGYTVTAGLGMVSVYRAHWYACSWPGRRCYACQLQRAWLLMSCCAARSYHKSPQFKAEGIKGTTADHCHPAINKCACRQHHMQAAGL